MGTVQIDGSTPKITVGNATAEDATILFDGNAQDFYIALDDSADDLLIGLGSTVGSTPAISIDENLAVKTYGDITMTGTTPVLTIGDAGAEDTAIVFDGNAQDFYIALDDSADDLVIGLGSTIGTTPIISLTEAGAVTMKNVGTGDDNPMVLTLQTSETDMAADDVIGKISFQAPDEGTGTDAVLVSGAIQAVAEGDHSSSSNATRLEFMTGASEAATAKMKLSSGGDLTVTAGNIVMGTSGKGIDFSATSDATAMSAELLDDYEEGTWTGTFASGSGTITADTSVDLLNYTKVGRVVYINGRISASSVSTPSGTLKMEGLPFTVDNSTAGENSGYGAISLWVYNLTGSVNAVQAMCMINSDDIRIDEFTGTTADVNIADHITAGTYFGLGGMYITAA